MSNRPIEDFLEKSGGSVYRLVRMAANRALELSEGKPRLVKEIQTDKLTTIALEEIARGMIGYSSEAGRLEPSAKLEAEEKASLLLEDGK